MCYALTTHQLFVVWYGIRILWRIVVEIVAFLLVCHYVRIVFTLEIMKDMILICSKVRLEELVTAEMRML